jgi:hypothetical protein
MQKKDSFALILIPDRCYTSHVGTFTKFLRKEGRWEVWVRRKYQKKR